MKNKTKTILIVIILIILVAASAFMINDKCYSHHKDNVAIDAIANSGNVTIKEINNGLFLDGPGNNSALIFYPGAGIDYDAYAPLAIMLSQQGIDVFLVDMPLNIAIINKYAADDIINQYNYTHWYMGGHSLGGVMASDYSSEHAEKIDGIILLGAYPNNNLTGKNIPLLSIYGSNDGVLNLETYNKQLNSMEINYTEVVIEGGNHGNFGSYGFEEKDNNATITPQQQWNETVTSIILFIHAIEENN